MIGRRRGNGGCLRPMRQRRPTSAHFGRPCKGESAVARVFPLRVCRRPTSIWEDLTLMCARRCTRLGERDTCAGSGVLSAPVPTPSTRGWRQTVSGCFHVHVSSPPTRQDPDVSSGICLARASLPEVNRTHSDPDKGLDTLSGGSGPYGAGNLIAAEATTAQFPLTFGYGEALATFRG